ncbi:glycosyltransferase [Rhodopila sp.]|uniref:glycosyltransferase n=1 Tax=Rhodopila sp. TaxID=2480087 RepID=UPI003D0FF60D
MPRGGSGDEPAVAGLARAAIARGLEALGAGTLGTGALGTGALGTGALGSGRSDGLRWLERAHRLVPHDPIAALTLASACLASDPARAAALFADITDRHDIRQAWLGLAAARLRLAGPDNAAEPLGVVLSRFALAEDALALARTIGQRPGCAGWCALRPDGRLEIHPVTAGGSRADGGVRVTLDGTVVRAVTLPSSSLGANWRRGRVIEVRIGDRVLLGSPIRVDAIGRLAGCVEVYDGGIRGWAWHPADPDTAPELTLLDASGRRLRRFVASEEGYAKAGCADGGSAADAGPLARPRWFELTRTVLPARRRPLHIVGADGRHLPGSPLDPFADEATHVAAALRLSRAYGAAKVSPARRAAGAGVARRAPGAGAVLRADAPVPATAVGADGRKRGVTVVLVVRDGDALVLACLDAVLATQPADAGVLVVDDGCSDPAMIAALDGLARGRGISVLRQQAMGLPAAANAGIRAARGRDVVLLGGDAVAPRNWLQRLRAAAYVSRDIGTVTPLSNQAGWLSYPDPGGNPVPDRAAAARLDRAAQRANGAGVVDIPVGVGFCLYLRRDCLNAVGGFRAELFAQGGGEEQDFCLRARRLGWRNVALTGLFVGRLGRFSAAAALRARNVHIVEQLHPGYQALIERFVAGDTLAEARRRIDLVRWRDNGRNWRRSAILISHDDGGGVEQRLAHAIGMHQAAGRRAIVLRPASTARGEPAVRLGDGAGGDFANLIYPVRELPALLRLLRAARPELIEAHHLAGYPAAIYDLVTSLRLPYEVHVHDYAWFCPRLALVGGQDRYCGEPAVADCETCIADHGHFLQEEISVAALRRRSARFLSGARRVVVPSDDAAIRMRRHFDGLSPSVVAHQDDAIWPGSNAVQGKAPTGRPVVCVVGGIGVHKGYDVLLACARDAARRDLDLQFVVVGHTIDDARMMASGRVFVTGRFDPIEAVALISQQNARLGFVPSICPETWCLSLGEIWRAGLPAVAFDIGAPAERIRRSGRGIVLPLGLPASAINNTLLATICSQRTAD